MNTALHKVAFVLISVVLGACTGTAAELPIDTYVGQFYLAVDDTAVVFLNGKPLMEGSWARADKVCKSSVVSVKVGDRLVFQLKSIGGPRFLKVEFATEDLKTLISFPLSQFRELLDPKAKDFKTGALDFGSLPIADRRAARPDILPFKNLSDCVWGKTDTCALAAILNREMIKPLTK